MKLARITKPLRSVQVRVMLAGDLNAELERYAQSFALSSKLTMSSSRGPVPATRLDHPAAPLRLHPTAPPRLNRDFHHSGTG